MGSTEVPMESMVGIDVPMKNMMDAMLDFTKLKEYIMAFPSKTILV